MSTCHWCHVMEKESFEDEEVAEILNNNFVSIKVDREERPDIDSIYMSVCQALTGHGGWPLTIVMTDDMKPFFAGTYFPKENRYGMPGLISVLSTITTKWSSDKKEILSTGNEISDYLNRYSTSDQAGNLTKDIINEAYETLKSHFDRKYGGFSISPKFPSPHNLFFLLRYWYSSKNDFALEMVEKTLDSMYRGGIYDHIGFGFARYSTDKKWLVPHFEKMLYDNALLAIAYVETFQATNNSKYADITREILEYVIRDMSSEEGGFYSAQDADSEGEEGKFYLWDKSEVDKVLDEQYSDIFCKYYNISEGGNFEGQNIPNLIKSEIAPNDKDFIAMCREKLFEHRKQRIHPYKDDKILTSWNGLMIAAMAISGRVLDNPKYLAAAQNAVKFIFDKLKGANGRLMARYRDGEAAYPAYVDDYAFLIWGLIELYEATFNPEYLEKAINLNNDLIKLFWDSENGGLYLYGIDSEKLITKPKEIYDGAIPSGNSVAAFNFLRLFKLTGDNKLADYASKQFKVFANTVEQSPASYTFLLSSFLYSLQPSKEVVLVGNQENEDTQSMLNIIYKEFIPFTSTLLFSDEYKDISNLVPFIKDYKTIDNKSTAYICENFSCHPPVTDINSLKEMLS